MSEILYFEIASDLFPQPVSLCGVGGSAHRSYSVLRAGQILLEQVAAQL